VPYPFYPSHTHSIVAPPLLRPEVILYPVSGQMKLE